MDGGSRDRLEALAVVLVLAFALVFLVYFIVGIASDRVPTSGGAERFAYRIEYAATGANVLFGALLVGAALLVVVPAGLYGAWATRTLAAVAGLAAAAVVVQALATWADLEVHGFLQGDFDDRAQQLAVHTAGVLMAGAAAWLAFVGLRDARRTPP